ncbi:ribokinase [Adhaeribacter aquaticus]|uniref:ribokinase n=1 Tax=Adhaeribacter aquaticus TaxID=299567 RepID=UPI0004159228|nr:ribokinase [Adhaeribacter aquaticus]
MESKIVVIGSSNTDMVIKADHFPLPGETLLGGEFLMTPGGKGANQAVAAARLGGQVTFITKVGQDIFGQQAQQHFRQEGIDSRFVLQDHNFASGVALITVDKKGENTIVVASGANGALTLRDVQNAEAELDACSFVLLQLEIPMPTVIGTTELANKKGKKVIINPAPATVLPDSLLQDLYLLTPNRTETETITGISITNLPSAQKAAEVLIGKGVQNVIITLGSEGALVATNGYSKLIPAKQVVPVDTTAAGDVFNGAIAVALSEGASLEEAALFASKAAAISVTRLGAQASAPYRKEISTSI